MTHLVSVVGLNDENALPTAVDARATGATRHLLVAARRQERSTYVRRSHDDAVNEGHKLCQERGALERVTLDDTYLRAT